LDFRHEPVLCGPRHAGHSTAHGFVSDRRRSGDAACRAGLEHRHLVERRGQVAQRRHRRSLLRPARHDAERVLAISPDSDAIFAVSIVFGLGYGGIFNASPTIIFEYFGTRRVGATMGLLLVFFGLGTASGGLLAGYLFDRTRAYTIPFTIDLALAAAGLLLLAVSGRQTRALTVSTLQSESSLA
jgi:hypothetical protein